MNYLPLILLVLVAGCSAPTAADQNSQPLSAIAASKNSLPCTYWPLDHSPQQSQTMLPAPLSYRITVITTCLNDSAVVNPITTDTGPALDVSHNYESVLTVARGKRLLAQVSLTKELFRHNQLAQSLGSLTTLSLSRTAFTKYQAPEFRFTTRLGVPDSDIFAEAEIALLPNQELRLASVNIPKEAE